MADIKELREIWLKKFEEHPELMKKRVPEGIEKYRKGDCKIRLTDSEGNPLKNTEVRVDQKTHDFQFGAHIFMLDEFDTEEENKKFRDMFSQYFNLATIPFYWSDLEPEEGCPRYDKDSPKIYRRPAPDLCLEYCEEKGIKGKLHCLVYDKFTADWMPKDDLKEMERLYEKRFKEISERYAGKLSEFEVINETLLSHGWTTATEIIKKPDLNEWAFSLAEKYFGDETLVMNEGGQNTDVADKGIWSAYYLELENAIKKGCRIDKIGMQHHLFTGCTAKTPEEYEKAIKTEYVRFADPEVSFKFLDTLGRFGLPLELTEVTIPTLGEGEEYEELQAEILKGLYSVWFSHPSVETIVYWNQIDGHCYDAGPDSNWNENRCRGGIFHHDLTPKKAALALKKLITEDWHTTLTLTTDEEGYIEFRGFYGDYTAEAEGKAFEIAIHKNENSSFNLSL